MQSPRKSSNLGYVPITSGTSGSGTSNEENRKRKRERDTDTDSLEDRIDSMEKLAKVKGSKIVTKIKCINLFGKYCP
jgi:hypothetical protein